MTDEIWIDLAVEEELAKQDPQGKDFSWYTVEHSPQMLVLLSPPINTY